MKKLFRKFTSAVLSILMLFSMEASAFAVTENCDADKITPNSDGVSVQLASGEYLTYTFDYVEDDIIISGWNSNGELKEKSIVSGDSVTQLIANGLPDDTVYKISDCVEVTATDNTALTITEDDIVSNGSLGVHATSSNDIWYEPPLLNDSGLSNSKVFSGYKYLGATEPDSIYEISIGVHRKIAKSYGTAYKFSVTAGTTAATLVGIIVAAVTDSISAGIATSLAGAFLSSAIDSGLTGTVRYERIHYTYKYTCNNSSTCIAKDCECREWWVIYNVQGEVGREEKNMAALNHLPLNLLARCSLVRGAYVNGEQPMTNCSLAAP